MIVEEVGSQALKSPEIMERANARILHETIQKQENYESRAGIAYVDTAHTSGNSLGAATLAVSLSRSF